MNAASVALDETVEPLVGVVRTAELNASSVGGVVVEALKEHVVAVVVVSRNFNSVSKVSVAAAAYTPVIEFVRNVEVATERARVRVLVLRSKSGRVGVIVFCGENAKRFKAYPPRFTSSCGHCCCG